MVCQKVSTLESKIVIRNRCIRLNMIISDSLRGVDGVVIELHSVAALIYYVGNDVMRSALYRKHNITSLRSRAVGVSTKLLGRVVLKSIWMNDVMRL